MLKSELNEKWRQWKSDLKAMAYDPSKTEDEVASEVPDERVDPNQYRELVRYWFSEEGQVSHIANSFLHFMYSTLTLVLFSTNIFVVSIVESK